MTPVVADEATLEGLTVSDMSASAAFVVEVPDQARFEFQADRAATFTQDGGDFRRRMAHGVPCEIDTAPEISVALEELTSSASKVKGVQNVVFRRVTIWNISTVNR